MKALDRLVRRAVYRSFLETSQGPLLADLMDATEAGREDVARSLRSLHEGRTLVLEEPSLEAPSPSSRPVRMAMPFSGRSTGVRVRSGSFDGFANCAWDALGIPFVTGEDAAIEAECPLGGEPYRVDVRAGRLAEELPGGVHFALPAREWWDDIGFT